MKMKIKKLKKNVTYYIIKGLEFKEFQFLAIHPTQTYKYIVEIEGSLRYVYENFLDDYFVTTDEKEALYQHSKELRKYSNSMKNLANQI